MAFEMNLSNPEDSFSILSEEDKKKNLEDRLLQQRFNGDFEEIPSDEGEVVKEIEYKSTDLVDAIDLGFDAETIAQVQADIPDSIEAALDIAKDIAEDQAEEALKASIQRAQSLRDQYELSLKHAAETALFGISEKREQYLKNMASMLYREVHNKAKLFLKDWAVVNNCRQKWRNPFLKEFSMKYITANSEFVPQVYSLSMVNVDTQEETFLAEVCETPREACITAAKKLGFDTSSYRTKALAKFPKEVRDVLLSDGKYLKEAKAVYTYTEHLRQIEMRRYVNSYLRKKWIEEVEKTLRDNESQII